MSVKEAFRLESKTTVEKEKRFSTLDFVFHNYFSLLFVIFISLVNLGKGTGLVAFVKGFIFYSHHFEVKDYF